MRCGKSYISQRARRRGIIEAQRSSSCGQGLECGEEKNATKLGFDCGRKRTDIPKLKNKHASNPVRLIFGSRNIFQAPIARLSDCWKEVVAFPTIIVTRIFWQVPPEIVLQFEGVEALSRLFELKMVMCQLIQMIRLFFLRTDSERSSATKTLPLSS